MSPCLRGEPVLAVWITENAVIPIARYPDVWIYNHSGMPITYRHDLRPPAEEIVKLYDASPLFRPTKDVERIRRIYDGSNVVLSAWDDHRLVGILRGWTDFAYDGYVCDLAVLPDYQKQGIGRELLRRVTDHYGSQVQWVLRASKIAVDYYKHIGWQPIENGWCWPRQD